MATGFVQLNPDVDATGKQLDNDVVTVPAGTIVTDGSGNQTTLAAPAFYFRERVVNADPNNPLGVATVVRSVGPNRDDYGLTVRLPEGNADLEFIKYLLLDIDTNIAAMLGTGPLGSVAPQVQPQFALPMIGALQPAQVSPTVPRAVVGDKFGRQVVLPHTVRELVSPQATTLSNTAAETTIITAGASDTFNDVVAIIGVNTSATATRVDIRDATAGTLILPLYLPAGDTRGLSLGGVLIPQTATANNWTAQCATAVTDVRIWALYIKNKQ